MRNAYSPSEKCISLCRIVRGYYLKQTNKLYKKKLYPAFLLSELKLMFHTATAVIQGPPVLPQYPAFLFCRISHWT